jgi:hypothetical protein
MRRIQAVPVNAEAGRLEGLGQISARHLSGSIRRHASHAVSGQLFQLNRRVFKGYLLKECLARLWKLQVSRGHAQLPAAAVSRPPKSSSRDGGASRRVRHAENHDRDIVRLPPAAVDH